MATACTDTSAAISGDVPRPRRRGKSKAPNFKYDGPVSVIRLELDVTDERMRQRLQRQWAAVFRLRRALQRDAARAVARFGRATMSGAPIRKRFGSGWGCPARDSKRQPTRISRPAGGCVIT